MAGYLEQWSKSKAGAMSGGRMTRAANSSHCCPRTSDFQNRRDNETVSFTDVPGVEARLERLEGCTQAFLLGAEFDDSRTKDVSILLLGDSVDRSTVWDINDTVWAAQSPGHRSLLNEHWRVALTLPRLEVV